MTELLTLQQLEDTYMDGSADEVSGNVDAPTGHFYRVGRQIVVTNSQGFNDVTDFETVEEAQDDFNRRGIEYASWDNDDPDFGEGQTDTEEDKRFQNKIEAQDA